MSEQVTIKGDRELMKRIASIEDKLMPKLGALVLEEARDIIAEAQANVPSDTGELAASFFVSGPKYRKSKHSATATCGYEAPFAAAEHEGFHWSKKRNVANPPKWLEKVAKGRTPELAQKVKAVLEAGLASAFPEK